MILNARTVMLALLLLILVGVAAAGVFIYSGLYNVAADAPHTQPVYALLETLRERSIARRADGLQPPDLGDPALIRQGSGNYDSMCVGCHLAPGMPETELSKGLYPAPPPLAKTGIDDAAEAFWAIKHGIKSTGMPAWGKSMSDEYIWGMVAFLEELPKLDAAAYRALVASSPGHSHGGGESIDHEHTGERLSDPVASPPAESDRERAVHRHANGSEHVHPSKPRAPGLDVPENARTAVTTVDAFSAAVAAGDFSKVESLLDPAVVILESGGGEHSRTEYLAGHAKADAKFLSGARVTLKRRLARRAAGTAWVATESEAQVAREGKSVTVRGAETMVLRNTSAGWRIVHIHWSNRPEMSGT